MTGIMPDVARTKVLGPAGTTVVLTIQRTGVEAPFDVTITRAKITVPQVDGKMLDNKIAYVKLYTFGDQTNNELRTYLKDLLAERLVEMTSG